MYCHKCGEMVPDDARFCEHCGTSVTKDNHNESSSNAESNVATHRQGAWSFGDLFSGRLGRMRYFQGVLLAFLPFLVLVTLWGIINIMTGTIILGGGSDAPTQSAPFLVNLINNIAIPILFALAFIFFMFAHFAVAIRRCHDLGYTGWVSLCTYIPYVGLIFGLIFLFKEGDTGVNKYGPSPVMSRRLFADIFNY